MHRYFQFIFALLVGFLASSAAIAHVGIHSAGGFAAGWAHPFMGLDHLLAMVAVGVWAAQLGGRHLLLLPAIFVATMAAGAVAATYGLPLPQVEGMVALSVLVLGLLVALALNTGNLSDLDRPISSLWYWPVSLVALFALFHGHAHGAEMPEFSAPWLYFAGFTIATAALHAIGVTAGAALKTHPGILRAGGAAIGLAGSWLLFAALA